MIFNSYPFLFAFLPAALAGTFLLARIGPQAARLWLIFASLVFYAAWNAAYLPLLLASILCNHAIAVRMARAQSQTTRNRMLRCAVAGNLALLGYYKYTGFFLDTLNTVADTGLTWPSMILPLGISFYTFQQLTLLADIAAGRIATCRLTDFLLFVVFFPHLIAGPIVHHRDMMPQVEKADYRFESKNLAIGLVLLAIGLFKKAAIADGIADLVSPVFHTANGHPIPPQWAWAAALGFALQMYFDFSGYSDMALGLACTIGLKLPMNFNSPLKARSIVEYWSRWHMSLTRFLTAYVYNPLAMSLARRRAAAGKPGLMGAKTTWSAFCSIVALPTLTTMFLSGLWHGAGNQFLIFGLIHGAALTVNHAWRLARPKFWRDTDQYQRLTWPIAWSLTFLTATVALVWFHSASAAAGWNIVAGMMGLNGLTGEPGVFGAERTDIAGGALLQLYIWIAAGLGFALIPPNALELLRRWQPALGMPPASPPRRPVFALTKGWACATAALAVAGVLGLGRVSEFLYWQF